MSARRKPIPEIEALLRGGWMCSNICYNLAQLSSTDKGVARSMRESYKAWDAAVTEFCKLHLSVRKKK